MLQKLFHWYNFSDSLQNICHVHFITKLLLTVFQEDALVCWSNDKHSPQDEALSIHVALVPRPPGPYEVLPHSQANEPQTSHPSLQRAVKASLFIYIDIPSEVRSEVLDLCANVLLHNSNQRDPKLFQLGLQRGQLRGFLSAQKSSRSSYGHDHSPVFLPQTLCFDDLVIARGGAQVSVFKVLQRCIGSFRKTQISVGQEDPS